MTRQDFKDLDLKNQVTEELQKTWYYQVYKDRIKINKHSVILDNTNRFELKYEKNIKHEELTSSLGYVVIVEDGTIQYELFSKSAIYDNEDVTASNPNHILEDIIVYVTECI